MENKIDFSKFCEEAHSICKDCRATVTGRALSE